MVKIGVFLTLFISFLVFSAWVYTGGTSTAIRYTTEEIAVINMGKEIFQKSNCISCHQVYGLGGYLGPELTTISRDSTKGELYIKAMITSGTSRMPSYKFNGEQMNAIIQYLKHIDKSATTY